MVRKKKSLFAEPDGGNLGIYQPKFGKRDPSTEWRWKDEAKKPQGPLSKEGRLNIDVELDPDNPKLPIRRRL